MTIFFRNNSTMLSIEEEIMNFLHINPIKELILSYQDYEELKKCMGHRFSETFYGTKCLTKLKVVSIA